MQLSPLEEKIGEETPDREKPTFRFVAYTLGFSMLGYVVGATLLRFSYEGWTGEPITLDEGLLSYLIPFKGISSFVQLGVIIPSSLFAMHFGQKLAEDTSKF